MKHQHRYSRRQWLATAAAATAAVCLPRGARADDAPILGAGEHRYRCLHDFGQLPADIQYGLTHGVAVDKAGNVHVLHTSRKTSPNKDTIVVFDRDGKFLRSWGQQFFGTAHGFDLVVEDGQEIFYVTDMARGLFKTTLDGKILWHLPKPSFYDTHKDLKYTPTNVAVAPDGDVYFADGYGSWFIHRLDRNGNYKQTFGGPGDTDAATIHPHGLHVDARGKEPLVVVAENDPKGPRPGRLHAFTLDCKHHSYLPTPVRSPRHFDRLGNLVVIPDLDAVVTLVDEKNQVVAQLGDGFTTFAEVRSLRTKSRDQFKPGQFICPHDAAFDPRDGSIYVSEWVDVGRVTKLQKV
jgi:DNA-binding beta-propeller fold protein YncE